MSDMQRWLNEGVQEGAPNMPPASQATPTDFSNWVADDPQINQLTASMRSARDKSPDTQAEVFNLQARTGLPADTIQRNLDIVRRRTQDEDFDARAFRDQWPKIAEYLSDPNNASVSYDDIESMGLLESSIKQANDRYNRDSSLGQRVWDRVREGITGFRASMAALPSAVTMGQTSGGTEQNREIGRNPITGMPIYASEVTFGDEQQQQLSEATTDIGRAAGIELARQIAPIQERLRDIETRPATQAMMQSESWGDVLEAFKLDPLGIVADIGISSTVQQLPALAAIIATRSPAVAVAASGGNAYALELGGGVADYLSKEGIDTTDTAAVIQALESDETAQAAVEYAERRAAIIGSVAGLAGGVAARNLAPSSLIPNQTAREGANIFVAQPVAQGVIGGSGEAGAQLATEGSISPGEVFAEAIGEFSGAPVDAAAFAVERIRSRPPKLVNDAINASNAEGTATTMAELGEAARNSRTMTRDPERFKALIQRITENGGFDSVQIPVAQWNELFQSRNMDPADVANQVLGDYTQYNEASESGADIVVPMDAFLEGFANQDYYAELSDHVRIAPGDMTPAEARQWEGNVEELVRSYAEEVPAEQSTQVYEDMLGQLLAAGRDRSTAEQEATLTQSVFRSLGERSGRDPMELYQSYNVNVSRPLPEVLRNAGEDFDVAIDPLLDRLRSGDVPTQQDVFGTSLMEFVRERGVRDEGGELSSRDIDAQRRAFQRSILRDDGQTLDEVAQAAAEAGYITGRDVSTVTQQDLIDALDRELGGNPVYAAGTENTSLQDVQGSLDQLSNYLDEMGIDLATMDNATIRQMLDGQEATQADGATTLAQDGQQPRGRITFPQSRAFFNIELLEGANLSTFIHESGHLYLEIMRDLAQREDSPQQIRDDFQSVIDWFGVQDADSIATEQHEQWARGFEAYIMEGKAPSAELRSTFARFRAWMVAIYRTISSLNVKLTDEVRGVMDRMVATDAEISEAQYEAGQTPIFDSAESAGMTQAEYAAYRRYAERSRDEAEDRLTRKVMDEYQRTTRKWWRDARRSMRDTVSSEVNQRPEYVAMSVMGRGKLPDGSDLPEGFTPFKLHRQALVDMYGKDFLKRLPRPYVYTREGGVHPDVAAQNFGYNSGDQMIQAMVSARPRRELIDAETDRRMLEQYGDMLNDGTMAEQALRDVHNQTRASVIQQEFSALARRTGMKGTPREVIRDAAKDIIARKVVRDVRPGLYLSAERKASSEAFKALARQDYRGAAEAKQRQLLNHYLYREATAAKADVDKLVAYTSRLSKKPAQQRLAKAGEEYQQQINQLLERYEFKRVPMRQIDRRRSLEAWIQEQQEQGFTVDVPGDVMNDSRVINYREVPVEELRGIRDALRQIEHLARTKNKLLTARDKRDFQELIDGVVASIDSNRTRSNKAPPLHENFADKIASFARDAHAWHTKPEFLARWLDGDAEQGPVWQALFRPIADAESAQQALTFEKTNQLREIMSAYTRQERAEWYSKGPYIQEVGQNVPKFFAISVALNWGNEYNRQVLLERYTPAQVEAMLNQLDQRDWNTVQGVWDLIDSLWPATEQLEKDLNGIAPQKVQAMPVETRFGTFKGGYYPIKYDARVSNQTFQNEERSAARLFENSFTRPATQRGHTKERQGSNGQVLRLDLNVISEHLGQVIHDVTHRRAVMDVNRMIENRQVREAIEETAGREMYRQLKPWLQAVANETQQPESYWEKLVGRARVGATVVNMGLKATTALAQPLGFFSSIDVLGERYAWKGLTDFWGARGNRDGGSIWRNMKDSTAFVQERSVMMQQRQQTYDRDVRDTLQRMTQETRAQELGRFYFYFTGLLDMSVSVPTWLGAYRKAMDGQLDNVAAGNEVEAIAYADSIVRMSQSAGTVANLARIQRGGQVQRAFVMFYSFFNVLYNQGARRISQARRGEISKQQMAASLMYLWIVPALLGELVAGRGPDEDDEEWAKWAATQGILYPAGTMVGMRDVVSGVLTPYGYDASPAYDAFEQSARAARIPLKLLDEDQDVTRGDVKAAFMATGYWAALPSRQAWITGEYLYDIATGEEEPETPQEFVRNLFFVRPQN